MRGVLEGGLAHSLTDAVLSALPSPRVDVAELPDAYVVTASLPGMKPDEVEVFLEGATLTIPGD